MSALKGITGEVAEALHVADVPAADPSTWLAIRSSDWPG
jgi:hypothetical protein